VAFARTAMRVANVQLPLGHKISFLTATIVPLPIFLGNGMVKLVAVHVPRGLEHVSHKSIIAYTSASVSSIVPGVAQARRVRSFPCVYDRVDGRSQMTADPVACSTEQARYVTRLQPAWSKP
jgi:hypothetical protein